jgi:hypothetical protein
MKYISSAIMELTDLKIHQPGAYVKQWIYPGPAANGGIVPCESGLRYGRIIVYARI